MLLLLPTGTIYLANGDKYYGDWKDGRRHGMGTYFYKYSHPLTPDPDPCAPYPPQPSYPYADSVPLLFPPSQ